MTVDEGPTLRRRRLGAELKRCREAAGLTQENVSRHFEWHAAKVTRGGDVARSAIGTSQTSVPPHPRARRAIAAAGTTRMQLQTKLNITLRSDRFAAEEHAARTGGDLNP